MSFTSVSFYLWLTGAVVGYRLLPSRGRGVYLVGLSCLFCGVASKLALLLLVFATLVAYVAGIRLAESDGSADERGEAKRTVVVSIAITLLIGQLVAFKAAGALRGVFIPLGLSYYTFKLISYVLDTYWDPTCVQRRFVDLAAYASFGAQLVSGPIQRPASFFEQLGVARGGALPDTDFERAFRLILHGLLLKLLIGDRLGSFTNLVTEHPAAYSRSVLAATAVTYLPQLYADFAGYTNIALGIGLLFGIEGPPNFDRPFAAPNIQEYWRRWHMSLTTWLNDYVFTVLRMQTRAWGKAGLVASVMTNMILIGVWHGFSWCYLAFGVIHGVFLSVSVLTLKARTKFFDGWKWLSPIRTLVGIVVVQLLVAVGQIVFQASSIALAWDFLRMLTGLGPAGTSDFSAIRTDVVDPLLPCWLIAVYSGLGAPGTKRLRAAVERWVPNWLRYGVCLLALAALTLEAGGKFIYGQF